MPTGYGDDSCGTPFSKFPEIPARTVEALGKKNITKLFPIQAGCFSDIFAGKDVIGRDLTGSGKTLAFCLPLVERFRKDK